MKPSSSIQVHSDAAARTLTVIDPPYVGLGIALVVVGVLSLGIWMGIAKAKGVSMKWGLLGLVTSLPFILGGVGILTSKTTLTLSRDSNQAKIESRYFHFFGDTRTFPLSELQGARVETSEGNRSLVLLLKSGQTLGLTSFSDRDGHYAAEKAINDFVKEEAMQEPNMKALSKREQELLKIARAYIVFKNLDPNEFDVKILNNTGDVIIKRQYGEALSRVEPIKKVLLEWKMRPAGQRGGDGHSRELRIDLDSGKVIQEIWPR